MLPEIFLTQLQHNQKNYSHQYNFMTVISYFNIDFYHLRTVLGHF